MRPARQTNSPAPLKSCDILAAAARKRGTVENVGILIIEDDAASQAALLQVLGAEGWVVEGAVSSSQAFQQLATGKWALVLANIATIGLRSALFVTLRELALPIEGEAAKAHVRVLFLVPEATAAEATPRLEEEHLPYV